MEYKTSQQLHANRRAKERLGIHFNRHMAREIINNIKARELRPKFSYKRGSWYETSIAGVNCWVFYNRETNRIVTVLDCIPREILERREVLARKRQEYRIRRIERDKDFAIEAELIRKEKRAIEDALEWERFCKKQRKITLRIYWQTLCGEYARDCGIE